MSLGNFQQIFRVPSAGSEIKLNFEVSKSKTFCEGFGVFEVCTYD